MRFRMYFSNSSFHRWMNGIKFRMLGFLLTSKRRHCSWNVSLCEATQMWGIYWWPDTWKTVHLDRGQNKQTNKQCGILSARVVIISLWNDKLIVAKLGRKTKELWFKMVGYRVEDHPQRYWERTAECLPASEEGEEPHSHNLYRRADSLQLRIAPTRWEGFLLNWARSTVVMVIDLVWTQETVRQEK